MYICSFVVVLFLWLSWTRRTEEKRVISDQKAEAVQVIV